MSNSVPVTARPVPRDRSQAARANFGFMILERFVNERSPLSSSSGSWFYLVAFLKRNLPESCNPISMSSSKFHTRMRTARNRVRKCPILHLTHPTPKYRESTFPAPSQQRPVQHHSGDGEVDHQAGDVDQGRHEGSRGGRRVEAQAFQQKRQHRAGQRPPQHHAHQ